MLISISVSQDLQLQGADDKLGQTLRTHLKRKNNSWGKYIFLKMSEKVYMHITYTII
jgi:hypothetical protein